MHHRRIRRPDLRAFAGSYAQVGGMVLISIALVLRSARLFVGYGQLHCSVASLVSSRRRVPFHP